MMPKWLKVALKFVGQALLTAAKDKIEDRRDRRAGDDPRPGSAD
jgi:hypothetical protein